MIIEKTQQKGLEKTDPLKVKRNGERNEEKKNLLRADYKQKHHKLPIFLLFVFDNTRMN